MKVPFFKKKKEEESKPKTILIVTEEWLAPDLALRMKMEGHNVLLAEAWDCKTLLGTIKRVPYDERMEYAKDADLVIYEDKSNGEASELRARGVSVIGGSKLADRIELDRTFGNKVAKAAGVLVPEMTEFGDFDAIKEFIVANPKKYVLKQQGKLDGIKGLNFVAKFDDSRDILAHIDYLKGKWVEGLKPDFVLQEKVEGHEFACGSYWNGESFMKDKFGNELCEINWEHKPLMSGDLGATTGEMYTVMRYVKAKESKLFMETLDKCRDLLKKIDFRGDFDINCIVNETGAYFLEFTPRMGVPATSAQIAIHESSWYEFLKAMADAKQDPMFNYSDKWTIVSWLYTSPFPYVNNPKLNKMYDKMWEGKAPTNLEDINELLTHRMSNSEGLPVTFKEPLTKEELHHVHFDGIMYEGKELKVSGPDGHVLTVTGQGDSVDEAAMRTEDLLKKIIVPKRFWRNDFHNSHYHQSREDLTMWGYL